MCSSRLSMTSREESAHVPPWPDGEVRAPFSMPAYVLTCAARSAFSSAPPWHGRGPVVASSAGASQPTRPPSDGPPPRPRSHCLMTSKPRCSRHSPPRPFADSDRWSLARAACACITPQQDQMGLYHLATSSLNPPDHVGRLGGFHHGLKEWRCRFTGRMEGMTSLPDLKRGGSAVRQKPTWCRATNEAEA